MVLGACPPMADIGLCVADGPDFAHPPEAVPSIVAKPLQALARSALRAEGDARRKKPKTVVKEKGIWSFGQKKVPQNMRDRRQKPTALRPCCDKI